PTDLDDRAGGALDACGAGGHRSCEATDGRRTGFDRVRSRTSQRPSIACGSNACSHGMSAVRLGARRPRSYTIRGVTTSASPGTPDAAAPSVVAAADAPPWDETVDVVVAGTGGSGLVAA